MRTIPKGSHPGITRETVEDYLKAHHMVFAERCCTEGWRAFSTIVKVGNEDVPWYCSDWPIYVLFEFTSAKQEVGGTFAKPGTDDILSAIHLGSNGEGCL